MKSENPDKSCLVVELRCACGSTLYLAASREEPCLLAFGATPAAAAAGLSEAPGLSRRDIIKSGCATPGKESHLPRLERRGFGKSGFGKSGLGKNPPQEERDED